MTLPVYKLIILCMSATNLIIHKYGEEILAKPSSPIINIDDDIVSLTKSMPDFMYENQGVGLAAPQVGHSISMVVVDPTGGDESGHLFTLINPEILEQEGGEMGEEGCLSLPGLLLKVHRSTRILVKAIDIDGKEFQREYEGFTARVIQHEIDHLLGKVIVDRVSSLKRQMAKKQIKRLIRDGEW